MENADKSVRDNHGPARVRHAVIRGAIGLGVMIAAIPIQQSRQEWHDSIHDGLLSGWNLGGYAPFLLVATTIIVSQSRTWHGTALACLGSLIAILQYELAAIATALLMSDWYPVVSGDGLLRSLPALAGVAVALPVSFGTVILITGRAQQKPSKEQESGNSMDGIGIQGTTHHQAF